jgi:hypothetical protein
METDEDGYTNYSKTILVINNSSKAFVITGVRSAQLLLQSTINGTMTVVNQQGQIIARKQVNKGTQSIAIPATGMIYLNMANQTEKVLVW